MSFQAMAWAVGQDPGDPGSKLLLIMLANYAGDTGLAWPSQVTLAADCNMTDRTVRTKLALLEELGLVTIRTVRQADGHQRSSYQLPPEGISAGHRKSFPVPPERISGEPTNEPFTTPPAREVRASVSRLSPSWQPREEDVARMKEAHPDVDGRGEAEKFRDYHAAAGSTRSDWDAAFRHWIRQEAKYLAGRRDTPAVGGGTRRARQFEDARRRAASYLGSLRGADGQAAAAPAWDDDDPL